MDDDGIMDRVVVVPDPESTNVDLSIYLGAGDGKLDPSRKPTFRRQGLALDWPLLAVEGKGKGSLVIVSGCGGCSNDYSTTLTIVYRDGEFLVGGYTYQWETRESAGTCDINFLTGQGTLLDGIDGQGKPISENIHAGQARRLVGRNAAQGLRSLRQSLRLIRPAFDRLQARAAISLNDPRLPLPLHLLAAREFGLGRLRAARTIRA